MKDKAGVKKYTEMVLEWFMIRAISDFPRKVFRANLLPTFRYCEVNLREGR